MWYYEAKELFQRENMSVDEVAKNVGKSKAMVIRALERSGPKYMRSKSEREQRNQSKHFQDKKSWWKEQKSEYLA